MRFKIDENLPVEVLELLRGRGHDVLTVVDQRLGGLRIPPLRRPVGPSNAHW